MNEYQTAIVNFVNNQGFILGKELNLFLQTTYGISSTNARKVVQRTVELGVLKSSKPVTFGNGQFAYLSKNKHLDKELVLTIAKDNRPSLYRVLKLIDLNKGIISYYEALKISGSSLSPQTTKTDRLDKLIKELMILKLIVVVEDDFSIKYLTLSKVAGLSEKLMSDQRSNMQMDASFIPDILRSLREYNIIDDIRVLYRNRSSPSQGVIHNNFIWDAIAYTKTTGINPIIAAKANSIVKQTAVLIDLIIYRDYTEDDLQGFYSRIQSVINSTKKGVRKVLPIIIYTGVDSKKTYNTMHKLGFLTFSLSGIFGTNVFAIIKSLNELRQYNLQGNSDKEDLVDIVEASLMNMKSGGQEINLQNIKGDLFEFLMYPVISSLFPNGSIEQGKKLKKHFPKKEEYEYDYLIKLPNQNEYIIVELKGYMSTTQIPLGNSDTRNTVSWFYGKTFPFAKSILGKDYGDPKISGCFITTASFKPEAISELEKLNKGKVKPSGADTWYDGEKLLEMLENKKLYKVKSIIEKYYDVSK